MEQLHEPTGASAAPGVREIALAQPLYWLRSGARDLAQAPLPSLFYGLVFAVIGYLALGVLGTRPYLVTAMISGFLLIAPFLAIGLYRISQRLEAGERVTLFDSMTAWRHNYGSIGLFAAFLGFAFIFWERLSAILFALFHGLDVPRVESLGGWIFLLGDNPAFLVLYVLCGGVAAAGVFALSVVSIPLMLDRRLDPVTALITSVNATIANPVSLLVWAVLIVVLVSLGIVTQFIGLLVVMPVLGHATWHAYRDLVASA